MKTFAKKSNYYCETRMDPACKGIWKESKADWIVLRICRVWMYEDCSVNEVRFLCELSHTEYLTHFRPMFHLCRNQVVSFYEQNV